MGLGLGLRCAYRLQQVLRYAVGPMRLDVLGQLEQLRHHQPGVEIDVERCALH